MWTGETPNPAVRLKAIFWRRKFLDLEMETFLFSGGSEKPQGYLALED